jgi:folate-binding protein YgfZ
MNSSLTDKLAADLQAAKAAVSGIGAVACQLVDQAVIRASGADAAEFLHNLLTNDIKGLPPATCRLAGFCTPKGRLLALFRVLRDPAQPDDILLMLPAEQLPAMLKKLSMYVLRSKVKLTDATADFGIWGYAGAVPPVPRGFPSVTSTATGSANPAPDAYFSLTRSEPRLWLGLIPAANMFDSPAPIIDLAAWRWLEICAGLPSVVAATQESYVPQMLNMELLAIDGINFRKGCYPGQEIVARTQYLGKIKRRMFRAHLTEGDYAPGTQVFAPETADQPCGSLVAIAPSPEGGTDVLVCVQSGAVEAGAVHVGALSGPVLRFLSLPYDLNGPDTRSA